MKCVYVVLCLIFVVSDRGGCASAGVKGAPSLSRVLPRRPDRDYFLTAQHLHPQGLPQCVGPNRLENIQIDWSCVEDKRQIARCAERRRNLQWALKESFLKRSAMSITRSSLNRSVNKMHLLNKFKG